MRSFNELESNRVTLKSARSSYIQLLRSSSITGAGAIISFLLGFCKTKAAALLMGPVGIGLLASYIAIQALIAHIAGFGLQTSGVRQISSKIEQGGDAGQVDLIIATLHRLSFMSGLIVGILMAYVSGWIGSYVFGKEDYEGNIIILGLSVLFINMYSSHMSVLQALQEIKIMAKVNVYSAFLMLIVSVIFYATLSIDGLVYGLVCISFGQYIIARKYSREVRCVKAVISWGAFRVCAKPLLKLGLSFMLTGLLSTFFSFYIVALIFKKYGAADVGFYNAAYSLSGLLVNFILAALVADYYPRLVKTIQNKFEAISLINQQTEIGVLIAIPGVIATYVFSPLIVGIVYSGEFMDAVVFMRIFLLGVFARVVAWPLGYVIIAKGNSVGFFVIEFFLVMAQLIMVLLLIDEHGVVVVPLAFTISAVINVFIEYAVARAILNFSYEKSSVRIILVSVIMLTLIAVTSNYLDEFSSYVVGVVVVFGCAISALNVIASKLRLTHPAFLIIHRLTLTLSECYRLWIRR